MRSFLPLLLLVLLLALGGAGCGPTSSRPEQVHHYQLTGRIVALDTKDQIATVDQAAIPGWMEAMTMEYPVKSKAEFQSLHVGDKIQATVTVHSGGDYDLSHIQEQGPDKSR